MKRNYRNYLKSVVVILIMTILFGMSPLSGSAQDQPTLFAIVDYMKVAPGNDGNYVDVEKNIWKPLHQERVNQGKIARWVLYRVRYTGSNDEYNYVTVTVFTDPNDLENPYEGISFNKIHPDKDMGKAMEKTGKSREQVRSHLIRNVGGVYPEGSSGPAPYKYVQVDFMNVKQANTNMYLDVELNIWGKVHREFINEGTRAGWSLWAAQYPSGTGLDYQYATANYFSDFSQIGAADFWKGFTKAHGEENVEELFNKTNQSRDLVRSELWEVVDSTSPKEQ